MIPMRSAAATTPPRRVSGIIRESTPKLMPSSSSGSSTTSSSPSRYGGDAHSGYTGSTLTTRFTAPIPRTASSPNRQRTREDASILRGAAVVRNNLIPRAPKSIIKNTAPHFPAAAAAATPKRVEEFSEDEWLDPWTQQEIVDMENELSSTPNEQVHWASMALLPRDDDIVSTRVTAQLQHQPQQRCVSPSNWAGFSDTEVPPPPQHAPPFRPASPTPSSDGTHVTSMGRNKSLRLKIVTYHVQSSYEMGDDTTCDGSYDSNTEEIHRIIPEAKYEEEELDNSHSLLSPLSKQFDRLQRDPAYLHAQEAGYLWQSLVGQYVRFPQPWFEGAGGPPMGTDAVWQYIARHSVHKSPIFTHLVHNRAAPGRLLLHLIVRDLMTGMVVFDLAVGIFHPNARGIRARHRPEPKDEESHHVWMAIRRISGSVSLMDAMLCRGKRLEEVARESPFGKERRSVTNLNMRAVFGDQPPVHTICIQESELYEKLSLAAKLDPSSTKAPALLILKEFLVLI